MIPCPANAPFYVYTSRISISKVDLNKLGAKKDIPSPRRARQCLQTKEMMLRGVLGEGKCWGLKWCIARVDCLPDCAKYGGKIEKKVDQ